MTVATILNSKPNVVHTISADASLGQAASLLAENRIGALVVCGPDHSVEGILSERDVVRDLAKAGVDAMEHTVGQSMTSNVKLCSSDYTIAQVMEIMTANRFRHLPVVESGKLTGIISIGDVVKAKIEQAEREAEDLKNYIAS